MEIWEVKEPGKVQHDIKSKKDFTNQPAFPDIPSFNALILPAPKETSSLKSTDQNVAKLGALRLD